MEKKQEKLILENIIKILRKGKYELSGDEVIVFYQSFNYIIDKIRTIDLELKPLPPVIIPEIKEEPVSNKKKKEKS